MAATVQSRPAEPLELNAPASNIVSLESFDLPPSNQKVLGLPHPPNTVTPLALKPSTDDGAQPDLDNVIHTVKSLQSQGDILTHQLARHGTLLFRGLPIHNAQDFSRFAHAFGYSPHEIIGIVVNRPILAPNVAPANEAPKEVLIGHHNESPQVPHAPGYVFFYAHRVPEVGGETPISSSLELFHRVRQEMPEYIEQLAQKGILSKVLYKPETQYAGGSTLKQAFGKEILDGDDEATRKAKIEAQIARYGRGRYTSWEWQDDGSITVTHKLPAVRTQPGTNLPTLFTGLAAYYKRFLASEGDADARAKNTQQLFGDGTPIPMKYLARLTEITEEIRVLHKWQEGDVLVYDNVIAQHGRQPWEGRQEDRVVMASLFDGVVPGAYVAEEWAQVVPALER